MPTKIDLPAWVYRNLEKFGNVALPYSCNKLNKQELENHLTEKMGFNVKLRQAIYTDISKLKQVEKTFWVAEAE